MEHIDFILYRDLKALIDRELVIGWDRRGSWEGLPAYSKLPGKALDRCADLILQRTGRSLRRGDLRRFELELRGTPQYAKRLALRLARSAALSGVKPEVACADLHRRVVPFPIARRFPGRGL